MKKNLSLIILILLILPLFSCKDKVTLSQPAFIGYWYGVNGSTKYVLNIDLESHATYKIEWPDSNSVTIEGTARANTTRLNITSKQYFNVEQYPHAIDTTVDLFYIPNSEGILFAAHYKMILNGLHKSNQDIPTGDFVYYK